MAEYMRPKLSLIDLLQELIEDEGLDYESRKIAREELKRITEERDGKAKAGCD